MAARLGRRLSPPTHARVAPRWIAITAVVTLGVPALATAASSQLEPPSPPALVQDLVTSTILTPVDSGIRLEAVPEGAGNRLRWSSAASWRADVFYRVYRSDGTGPDTLCSTAANVAWNCYLKAQPIGTARDQTFVDSSPPPQATYRVGVGTNWADDPEQGDVFVLSPAVEVSR